MANQRNRTVKLNAGGLLIDSRYDDEAILPTLGVKFEVVRSLTKDPNTAKITISNLKKTNRAKLQEKNIPVILEAGYPDNINTIFSGVLGYGVNTRGRVTWETMIQSGDGQDKFKSARINVSMRGPVDVGAVLEEAGNAMGLDLGNLKEKVKSGSIRKTLTQFANGITLSGKAEKVLDRVTKSLGYSYSIQNGKIQILGPNEVLRNEAILINKDTGMIGSPEPGDKGYVSTTFLLHPDAAPGKKVKIESREINGFYRIDKVTFVGDTWGQDWYSKIEAKPL